MLAQRLDLSAVTEENGVVALFGTPIKALNAMVEGFPVLVPGSAEVMPIYFEACGKNHFFVVALWPDHARITSTIRGARTFRAKPEDIRAQKTLDKRLHQILADASAV